MDDALAAQKRPILPVGPVPRRFNYFAVAKTYGKTLEVLAGFWQTVIERWAKVLARSSLNRFAGAGFVGTA